MYHSLRFGDSGVNPLDTIPMSVENAGRSRMPEPLPKFRWTMACAAHASLGAKSCACPDDPPRMDPIRVRTIRITPPRDLDAMTTEELIAERDRLMKECGIIGGIGR